MKDKYIRVVSDGYLNEFDHDVEGYFTVYFDHKTRTFYNVHEDIGRKVFSIKSVRPDDQEYSDYMNWYGEYLED